MAPPQPAGPMLKDARVRGAEGRFTIPADCALVQGLDGANVGGVWTRLKSLGGSRELMQVRYKRAQDGSYEAQIKHADGRFVAENSHVSIGFIKEDDNWRLGVEVSRPYNVISTMSSQGTLSIAAGTSLAELLKDCGAAERGWVRMHGDDMKAPEIPVPEGAVQAVVAQFTENPDGSFTATMRVAVGPEDAMPEFLSLSEEHLHPPPSE